MPDITPILIAQNKTNELLEKLLRLKALEMKFEMATRYKGHDMHDLTDEINEILNG